MSNNGLYMLDDQKNLTQPSPLTQSMQQFVTNLKIKVIPAKENKFIYNGCLNDNLLKHLNDRGNTIECVFVIRRDGTEVIYYNEL